MDLRAVVLKAEVCPVAVLPAVVLKAEVPKAAECLVVARAVAVRQLAKVPGCPRVECLAVAPAAQMEKTALTVESQAVASVVVQVATRLAESVNFPVIQNVPSNWVKNLINRWAILTRQLAKNSARSRQSVAIQKDLVTALAVEAAQLVWANKRPVHRAAVADRAAAPADRLVVPKVRQALSMV